jgi:hypothetical protein
MDLSGFNVKETPMTEAKQDLIVASKTVIDEWISEHYNELVNGFNCREALNDKPKELKLKSFQLQLKEKCDRKKIRDEWKYVMKSEMEKNYEPEPDE